MEYPVSYVIKLCSSALVDGCLLSRSIQNATGYADVSLSVSQSGVYSLSVHPVKSKFLWILENHSFAQPPIILSQ